ncbi:MAG: S-layer homology domain-containing protein [Oscillospiraceae bacterium]|nr:S-layer homology domain-containing protein [Oscillospiraceae bacterium]
MRKMRRLVAFFICLSVSLSLASVGSAAEFQNSDTYLRTSYNSQNYIELSISGSELTVSGKLISENLTSVLAEVGGVRKYTEAKSGEPFSFKVDLSKVVEPTPVDIYTRQSHNESYWSLVYESIYVMMSAGKYRFSAAKVTESNSAMLSEWMNPAEYLDGESMPELKKLASEIVGGTTGDYERAFLLHRWVAENIYYDYDSYLHGADTFTEAHDILENRRTVASGYSEILLWLLRAVGIPAFKTQTYALGLTSQGGSFAVKTDEAAKTEANHEFVEAFAGGRWIVMDPSWDSNNEYENGETLKLAPYGFYYFDITPEALSNEQKVIKRGDKITLGEEGAVNENTTDNGLKPASWAIPEVLGAMGAKLVPADLQKNYTEKIDRGDFCRLIMNLMRVSCRYTTNASVLRKYGKELDPEAFTDTDDPDVLAAYALGIVNGTGNGKFHPEHDITREQAATMLKRAADVLGISANSPKLTFNDFGEVSGWAAEGVEFVSSLTTPEGKAVMGGVGEGLFSPATFYTVQQAILTVYRMYLCR